MKRKIYLIMLLSVMAFASCSQSSTKRVVVVAKTFVKPEAVELFKAAGKEIVLNTQKEEGCIRYNLHQDVSDSTVFLFYEEYVDMAAFESHKQQPHFAKFKEATSQFPSRHGEANVYEAVPAGK